MKKIVPCLWFDGQAEEAARFYVSAFPDSKVGRILRWGKGGHGPEGSVLTVDVVLRGKRFLLLNGGPGFKPTMAVSFIVECETQAEVDRYWKKLVQGGGTHSQCGWLQDRFGMWWQVTPTVLVKMIMDRDQERADRVMQAMMPMGKLDIAKLKKAYGRG